MYSFVYKILYDGQKDGRYKRQKNVKSDSHSPFHLFQQVFMQPLKSFNHDKRRMK